VYQKTMLKITTQASNISIINTFNQSSIKKRIIMLNTNQSHRKNIWKVLLILPIIAGFIYLFQVKVVAQEKKSVKFKPNNQEKNSAVIDSAVAVCIGYITNKNTTEEEMKNDAASLQKYHNIDYKFSNIKRNEKNEIIAIKFSFNDNKGNNGEYEVIGDEPIKPIHFTTDVDENGKGQIGFFEHKLKEGKNISNVKVAFITKKDTDNELISRLAILEDENVIVKFSNIKRNKKNEIIAIKIIAKNSDNKEVKYEQINDDGIEDVFIMKEIGGKNKLTINSKKDKN
jgi:hypothetical protein